MSGAVRGFLITYGIGALSFFSSKSEVSSVEGQSSGDPLYAFVLGLLLQGLLFVMRALIARYERAHGLEGAIAPVVMYIIELLIDAVTVLLFALGTLRSIRLPTEML